LAAESAVEASLRGSPGTFGVNAAKRAVKEAASHAMYVLEGLDVSDPIRTLYWAKRKEKVQLLLSRAGLDSDDMQTE
jgi:hypothetical protein